MKRIKNVYIKQAVEMSEEEKKYMILKSSIVQSLICDCELGKVVREMMNEKIKKCDEYINHMKSLENK